MLETPKPCPPLAIVQRSHGSGKLKFKTKLSFSDPLGHRSQPGERQQQAEGGEARHGGHPHVRRVLAPHTAHPPTEVRQALPSHNPQHLSAGWKRTSVISCCQHVLKSHHINYQNQFP